MGYHAGRHLSFACEADTKYAEPGHWHIPPPSQGSRIVTRRQLFWTWTTARLTTTRAMASLRGSALLPQCTSCIRRVTRQNLDAWRPQQTRNISKKAKEAERNIIVKLLKDVPRFGRAGTMIHWLWEPETEALAACWSCQNCPQQLPPRLQPSPSNHCSSHG